MEDMDCPHPVGSRASRGSLKRTPVPVDVEGCTTALVEPKSEGDSVRLQAGMHLPSHQLYSLVAFLGVKIATNRGSSSFQAPAANACS